MKHFALLTLACFAAPALADNTHLNGMAEEILASEWADPVTLDDYLFEPIQFDHPSVQSSFLLDASNFAEVLSIFGGAAQTEEILEGSPVTWACYETGNGRTSFVSLRTGEGDDSIEPPVAPSPILNVIVEEANAPANAACTANPAAVAPLPGSCIPRLGATRQDLFACFGGRLPERDGPVAYIAHAELGDEDSWIETKTIYYRLENGLVTGVAYKLTTER